MGQVEEMNVTPQEIAAQAVRYCNAMDAYEAREAYLRKLAFSTLRGMVVRIAQGDEDYVQSVTTQPKSGLVATLVEFECGGAVQEAEELLKTMGVDVEQLEEIRRAGKNERD